ncbi:MAG: hypothetical protein QJR02_09270 [Sinobacteraceae bacterium]|nr:hypothetical protein [Nevskia sp.]MDI3259871.1 hypothetical protein [Nevskiaceae bacterium]
MQQLSVGEHLAGLDHELLEELVFLGCEVDFRTFARNPAMHQIHAQAAASPTKAFSAQKVAFC